MSEKKFEECSLQNTTHIEVNGKMIKLGCNEVVLEYYHNDCIGLGWKEYDAFIPLELFPILGIKTLKEIKPEPIVFEATFVKHDGQWHTLAILNDNFAYLNNKKVRFKCVEILEEKK